MCCNLYRDYGAKCAYLFSAGEKESVRIYAIGDGAANDGNPVEDDGGFMRVLKQKLLQHIEDDGDDYKGGKAGADDGCI